MATVEVTEATRTCTKCGRELDLTDFPKSARCRDGRTHICRRCDNARKRRHYHGIDFGHQAVDTAPDRRPAIRLRRSLERSRDQGQEWSEAWPQALSAAVSGLRASERAEWRQALSWAQPYWQAAYLRAPFNGCTPLCLPGE